MDQPGFDPLDSVKIDLGRGRVLLDNASARVLVPSDLLLDLCESAGPEARRDFARRLGTMAGRRVADRLGDGAKVASIELILDHVGGDLALLGLGSLGVERWGRALVLTVEGSPFGASGDELIAAVLEGVVQRVFSRDAALVVLERRQEMARLLVSSEKTAPVVRGWLRS